MPNNKPYWILECQWTNGNWAEEFGSHDRSDVVFERQCYVDEYGRNGSNELKASDIRVRRV